MDYDREEIRQALAELGESLRRPGLGPRIKEWQSLRPEGMPTPYWLWRIFCNGHTKRGGSLRSDEWSEVLAFFGLKLPPEKVHLNDVRKLTANSTGEPVRFITPEQVEAEYPIVRLTRFERRKIYLPHRHGWATVRIAEIL